MSLIKTEYKVEVWEETWIVDENLESGGYWNEYRRAILGSNDMEYPGKIFNPILKQNINGEVIFTFDITTKYFNPETNLYEENYLIPFLFNEAKIKLYCPKYATATNGGWFDFVIKEINEKREKNITYSYICQYLPINELSKTGQNLVFSLELSNNVGSIDELTDAVLEGTDWELDVVTADITEKIEETLFSVTLGGALALTGIPTMIGTPTSISLGNSDIIYIPYSEITSSNINMQVIYISGGIENFNLTSGNVITNSLCNYTITRSLLGTPTYNKTDYRGYKILTTYETIWDNELSRYVTVYEKSPSDGINYYGYEHTNITVGNYSQDLSLNGDCDENYTTGWETNSTVTLGNATIGVDDYITATYPAGTGTYYIANNGPDIENLTLVPYNSYILYIEFDWRNSGGNIIAGPPLLGDIGLLDSINGFVSGTTGGSIPLTSGLYYPMILSGANNTNIYSKIVLSRYATNNNARLYIKKLQFFSTIVDTGISYTHGTPIDPSNIIKPEDFIEAESVVETIYYFYNRGIITYVPSTGLNKKLISNSEKYRTLEAEKSNRFNLIQNISELFEVWARFDIYHDLDGKISLDPITKKPIKKISFVDQIGSDKWAGFTYGINLKGITRNIISNNLATKIFIEQIINDNLNDGVCSIAYAPENISREEFLINLDYYTQIGLLDNTQGQVTYDLYSVDGSTGIGYLTNLGIKNNLYNSYISNAELLKTYIVEYEEKVIVDKDALNIALQMVSDLETKYNNGVTTSAIIDEYNNTIGTLTTNVANARNKLQYDNSLLISYKAQNEYAIAQQTIILNQKIELHNLFNTRYSRFIQEGSWSDDSYTESTKYYYDALKVLLESSRPNIEYNIDVIDISLISGYEDFTYKVGDLTYVEDVEYFGYRTDSLGNRIPYRETVIISELESNLDNPQENKVIVQNYQNQFDGLFQRMTASVQGYEFNKNIYQRANNFTTTGELTFDSLQSSLINNQLILAQSDSESFIVDNTGITLTDLDDSNKQVRLVSGGIFISNDGGDTWNSGITGSGINTNLLLAGRIDAAQINIFSGSFPCFTWDSSGLTAYAYTEAGGIVTGISTNTYVQFDHNGIHAIAGGDIIPSGYTVTDDTIFSLDWNGLYLKTGAGVYDVQLGLHTVGTANYLFSAINNITNARTFSIDENGNAYFNGSINATSGYFSGEINATSGTISGDLTVTGRLTSTSLAGQIYADRIYQADNINNYLLFNKAYTSGWEVQARGSGINYFSIIGNSNGTLGFSYADLGLLDYTFGSNTLSIYNNIDFQYANSINWGTHAPVATFG